MPRRCRSVLSRRPMFIGMMTALSGAGVLVAPIRASEGVGTGIMVLMDEIAVRSSIARIWGHIALHTGVTRA